jgi:hypothetical protein
MNTKIAQLKTQFNTEITTPPDIQISCKCLHQGIAICDTDTRRRKAVDIANERDVDSTMINRG